MADHLSEEEQIEAFKRWWAENGLQMIAAVVLIVGGYFGWQFWQIMDCRTLFQLMPTDPRKAIDFAAHNALEDCKVQALCVQQTVKQLGLTLR